MIIIDIEKKEKKKELLLRKTIATIELQEQKMICYDS